MFYGDARFTNWTSERCCGPGREARYDVTTAKTMNSFFDFVSSRRKLCDTKFCSSLDKMYVGALCFYDDFLVFTNSFFVIFSSDIFNEISFANMDFEERKIIFCSFF